MGAGRCCPSRGGSPPVQGRSGGRRLAPFIARGMAGGGGAERPGAGGLLPPALRQHRRRVSPGTRRKGGPGRFGAGGAARGR